MTAGRCFQSPPEASPCVGWNTREAIFHQNAPDPARPSLTAKATSYWLPNNTPHKSLAVFLPDLKSLGVLAIGMW